MDESEENIKEISKQIEEKHKIINTGYSKLDGPLADVVKSLKQR